MDYLYGLNLQLFAGEGGAEGGEAGAAEVNSEATAEGAGAQTAEAQTKDVDSKPSFKDLINSEYKDEYTKEFNKQFNARFKDYKTLQSAQDKLNPLISLMSERLGVKSDDIDGLVKAYTNDEAYIDHIAIEEGISSEEARKRVAKSLEDTARNNELERLRAESAEREAEEARRQQFNAWHEESESLKAVYPNLDFAAELQNPETVKALQMFTTNGFADPFKQAFELSHRAEILSGAMQQAVKAGADAATRSKASTRPAENGVGGSVGAATKIDVNNLTPAQIEEFIKQAQGGKRVTFA